MVFLQIAAVFPEDTVVDRLPKYLTTKWTNLKFYKMDFSSVLSVSLSKENIAYRSLSRDGIKTFPSTFSGHCLSHPVYELEVCHVRHQIGPSRRHAENGPTIQGKPSKPNASKKG